MNDAIIAAAGRRLFTLDVAAQITGIPQRLIGTLVAPHPREANGVQLYALRAIVRAFKDESGARLLRKLHQNQLQLFRDCSVAWRDNLGTLRTAEGGVVEIRGRRAEITLRDGYRVIRSLADPDLKFSGTAV